MQDPITLKTGAVLQVTIASFEDADELAKIVARELLVVNFDLDTLDFSALGEKDINTFKNVFFQLIASKPLAAQLWACAGKCLLNDERITKATFQPENMREHYFPCMLEVMKANLIPFFKGLGSLFSALSAPTSDAPKSA